MQLILFLKIWPGIVGKIKNDIKTLFEFLYTSFSCVLL